MIQAWFEEFSGCIFLNERFGTDFTEADQLFFDQVRATAESSESIAEVARANSLENFSSYLDGGQWSDIL